MVSTWWHPPIVIKILWRKLPLEQRKNNCFKEEGMPISINMFGVQLSYLGTAIGLFWPNIYIMYTKNYFFFLLFPFSHFSQMRSATHFVLLGHIYLWNFTSKAGQWPTNTSPDHHQATTILIIKQLTLILITQSEATSDGFSQNATQHEGISADAPWTFTWTPGGLYSVSNLF
jgi:hypothetical protein